VRQHTATSLAAAQETHRWTSLLETRRLCRLGPALFGSSVSCVSLRRLTRLLGVLIASRRPFESARSYGAGLATTTTRPWHTNAHVRVEVLDKVPRGSGCEPLCERAVGLLTRPGHRACMQTHRPTLRSDVAKPWSVAHLRASRRLDGTRIPVEACSPWIRSHTEAAVP
jgi:hypothetical protein